MFLIFLALFRVSMFPTKVFKIFWNVLKKNLIDYFFVNKIYGFRKFCLKPSQVDDQKPPSLTIIDVTAATDCMARVLTFVSFNQNQIND